jgi:hypothetical protein
MISVLVFGLVSAILSSAMNIKNLMAMAMTMVSFYVYDDANELLLLLLSRLNKLTPPCHFLLPRNHEAYFEANCFCSDPF